MSKLLSMQDNLLKASAAELLRTDTLRLTTKELNEHTVYLPDTHVLVHYRTGSPPTRLHTYSQGRPVAYIYCDPEFESHIFASGLGITQTE